MAGAFRSLDSAMHFTRQPFGMMMLKSAIFASGSMSRVGNWMFAVTRSRSPAGRFSSNLS